MSPPPELDAKFLGDTMLPQDAQKVMAAQEQLSEKASRLAERKDKFRAAARASFASVRSLVGHKSSATAAQKAKSAPDANRKAARIYAALDKDADRTLKTEAPADSIIWSDDKNGRWKLGYRGLATARRSVSWTNVGQAAASVVALRQLWDWHTSSTSEVVPAHLQAMFEKAGV